MLPSPKDCTACGGTHNTADDPLVLYCWRRTGVAVGWVRMNCRGHLLRGMQYMNDHLRDRGVDVPERDPGELWDFLAPN